MEPVNLKRLAKELNLSISTVSKALRDSYEIGVETKKKVQELAQKLNYQPNPHASSLRRQKSKTIALVIPEIANNYFSLVINGIESVAQERDYHVLIYLTHEDLGREVSIIKHLQGGRVAGVLMSLSMQTVNYGHLFDLAQQNTPIVFFDRICHEMETAKIITDDFQSSFKATEHLIQRGCKDIAFIGSSKHLSNEDKRMQGFIEALQKHNIKIKKSRIVYCSENNASNHSTIKKLMMNSNRPDAIFASIEKLAITAYEVCGELKIKIPQQLKIICFSNIATAHLMNPPLTCIRQPAFEMGRQAAEILIKNLDKNRTFIPNELIVVKSELSIRSST